MHAFQFRDLILGVFILNRILTDTDPEIVREHWSGDGDVLVMVRRVLEAADSLVSPRVLAKIKRILKQGWRTKPFVWRRHSCLRVAEGDYPTARFQDSTFPRLELSFAPRVPRWPCRAAIPSGWR